MNRVAPSESAHRFRRRCPESLAGPGRLHGGAAELLPRPSRGSRRIAAAGGPEEPDRALRPVGPGQVLAVAGGSVPAPAGRGIPAGPHPARSCRRRAAAVRAGHRRRHPRHPRRRRPIGDDRRRGPDADRSGSTSIGAAWPANGRRTADSPCPGVRPVRGAVRDRPGQRGDPRAGRGLPDGAGRLHRKPGAGGARAPARREPRAGPSNSSSTIATTGRSSACGRIICRTWRACGRRCLRSPRTGCA